MQGKVYNAEVYSFTKNENVVISVAGNYLAKNDRILIVDDFLAMGSAAKGLVEIVKQSGATLIGVGVVIEKGFQKGGELLRASGIRVESLVSIKSLHAGQIEFA